MDSLSIFGLVLFFLLEDERYILVIEVENSEFTSYIGAYFCGHTPSHWF